MGIVDALQVVHVQNCSIGTLTTWGGRGSGSRRGGDGTPGVSPMVRHFGPRGALVPVSVEAMQRAGRAAIGWNGEGISELDKGIIERLQSDGRRPYTQIAAELGVSEAAVRARTNRLVERGVLQIVGVADPLKLGYDQMALIGVRIDGDTTLAAAEAIAQLPEVIYVVVTAGGFDLLVEVVCRDNESLYVVPDGETAARGGRGRDGDVRLPAHHQAVVPLGDTVNPSQRRTS